ncbi:MAG: DNA repair protein RecO [Candidatus Omnitrophica bacterium]|nr:DNA repair protein RecO [Candidatus Omnitrophota bacterium]
MALTKTEGLVIKKTDFRETSLIVLFYTKDYGKLNLLFKGIKNSPDKFASNLEPFSYNEIIFYKKKNTTLHLASQCDLKDNFSNLREDLDKVSSASSIIELLDTVMPPEDPNRDAFNLALESLKNMSNYPSADKILTIFKIKLLDLVGFKPHLDSCIICQEKIITQARFSISLGGLLCQNCFKNDLKARPIFRGTTATILHIERNSLEDNLRLGINPQIKKELDYILESFLEFHLDKRLKTKKYMLEINQNIKILKNRR